MEPVWVCSSPPGITLNCSVSCWSAALTANNKQAIEKIIISESFISSSNINNIDIILSEVTENAPNKENKNKGSADQPSGPWIPGVNFYRRRRSQWTFSETGIDIWRSLDWENFEYGGRQLFLGKNFILYILFEVCCILYAVLCTTIFWTTGK